MKATRNAGRSVGHATGRLVKTLQQNRRGRPVGVYSICSANRFVMEAGMLRAERDGSLLLVESTSSQVNQFGGYTGQTPAQFVAFAKEVAAAMDFPLSQIVFGGDHLGPNAWRNEEPATGMEKAVELVRACVLAGYTKIHLDASMRLAGDPGNSYNPLPEEIVSARAAELCQAAEEAHSKLPNGSPLPLYVIGTEVPIPGGELSGTQAPQITRVDDAARTLQTVRRAFDSCGLQSAWERVIALVVQPGVEFGDEHVFPYAPKKTHALSRFIEEESPGVFEAHSTDYQTPAALRAMVRDHFAILKVGPWLTFAFREAVFSLAAIEEELLGARKDVTLSRVREALEEAMLARPEYWKGYYRGDNEALRIARKYSLSDRARYYWPQPRVVAAFQQLIENLARHPVPVSLLSQFLPNQAVSVMAKTLANNPPDLVRSKILEVIDQYADACGMRTSG